MLMKPFFRIHNNLNAKEWEAELSADDQILAFSQFLVEIAINKRPDQEEGERERFMGNYKNLTK